jgi:hypothetical protein
MLMVLRWDTYQYLLQKNTLDRIKPLPVGPQCPLSSLASGGAGMSVSEDNLLESLQ